MASSFETRPQPSSRRLRGLACLAAPPAITAKPLRRDEVLMRSYIELNPACARPRGCPCRGGLPPSPFGWFPALRGSCHKPVSSFAEHALGYSHSLSHQELFAMSTGWIVFGVIVILLLFAVGAYIRLVALGQRAGQAFAHIDVQLKRRDEL